jgi:hypothetical protein
LLRKLFIEKEDYLKRILLNIFSLGAEDANRLLTSTSTTVIRTEARAAGESHVEGATAVVGTTASTVQTASSQSSQSSQSASSARTTQ